MDESMVKGIRKSGNVVGLKRRWVLAGFYKKQLAWWSSAERNLFNGEQRC
jgi:hypothetical protein